MFYLCFLIQHIFTAQKRKLGEVDKQPYIKKRLVYTNEELLAAQSLIELNGLANHPNKKDSVVFIANEENTNLRTLVDNLIDKDTKNLTENKTNSVFLENTCKPTEARKNNRKKLKLKKHKKDFQELKNKHVAFIRDFKFKNECKATCNFHIWQSIDITRLAIDFEKQLSFNLNYLFEIIEEGKNDFIQPFFRNGIASSDKNYYKIFSKLTIDPGFTHFDLEDNLCKESTDSLLKFPNLNILPGKYESVQNKMICILNSLCENSINYKSYMINQYDEYKNFYESKLPMYSIHEFLLFCINDYLKFENHGLIEFLFPEFEIIKMILDGKVDREIIKKCHFFICIFHFRYLFFRDIIRKEFIEMQNKKEGFDILRCKYFSYFLFSSKIIFQVFLYSFSKKFKAEVEDFVFTNFLYFIKLKFMVFRARFSFNTLFLLNPFKAKHFTIFSSKINQSKKYKFNPISVLEMPKSEEILGYYNEKKDYTILNIRLSKCLNQQLPEDFFMLQNDVNILKIFFETRFYNLLLSELK
ncbi:hypothetical protein TUBRATIS_004630 [Tubulinosema ratisbonensis]|uniref:Uncharacterized protein n=1 Tax=Tubulinosema ratisbonensis TaxID=291195 RepID=A0A437AP49_9MICR|nr:hypothetical protein TUBRATIS_004630 [Tubulinosema ratisbonensis]